MRQYATQDITLGRDLNGGVFTSTTGGITLGASATNTVISQEFSVSRAGSLDIRVKASSSAVTSSSGITIALQHWDGVPTTSSFTFTDTDVSVSGNTITKTAHGQATGDTVIFTSPDTLPAPLVAGATYYVIRASSSTIKVATTSANATAGTAVDITDAGTSSGTFTASFSADRWVTQSKAGTAVTANGADNYILLRIEVSGDQADLPLMPRARVVASTGSGDAVTFTNVTVMQGL